MPEQFADTKASVVCNDCAARTITPYHWLGNKCLVCDSYNTIELRLVDCPPQQEAEALEEGRDAMLDAAEEQGALPAVPPEHAVQEVTLDALRPVASSPPPRNTSPGTSATLNSPRSVASDARVNEAIRDAELRDGDDEDGDEDDITPWGDGIDIRSISPAGWSVPLVNSPMSAWSMPAVHSPMSGWSSPRFLTGGRVEEEEEDGEEGSDKESISDGEDVELIPDEEDEGEEGIDLLGHR